MFPCFLSRLMADSSFALTDLIAMRSRRHHLPQSGMVRPREEEERRGRRLPDREGRNRGMRLITACRRQLG